MSADGAIITAALGQPLVLDAADFSGSRRRRSYWTNIPLPIDHAELTAGFKLVDANLCMDPDRRVESYFIDGKTTIRTIGKSWQGDPANPTARTNLPVIVHDDKFEKAQHLNAEEAERIIGFQTGATAGRGVSLTRTDCKG